MPTISHFARSTAESQGWTDATLLGVMLDFMENQDNKTKADFARYVDERAKPEEDEGQEVIDWFTSDGFKDDPLGALELIENALGDGDTRGENLSLKEAVLRVARGES